MIHGFQNRVLPWIMGHYESLLRWALKGWRPAWLLVSTFLLLIFSFVLIAVHKVVSYSSRKGIPTRYTSTLKLPVGTNVDYTDSVTQILEKRVYGVLGMGDDGSKPNPVVESVISNVAVGANDPTSGDQSTHPELGRIQVSFVEFAKRHGISTARYLDSIRHAMIGIPGSEITVDQENSGPPTDPPVNIEVASDNFDDLIKDCGSTQELPRFHPDPRRRRVKDGHRPHQS